MKIKKDLVFSLFFSLLFLALLGFSLYQNQERLVKESLQITIDKSNQVYFINQEVVKDLLKTADIKVLRRPAKELDLHLLEESLTNYPLIKKAELFILPNGELNVHVLQETPTARIQNGKEEYYLTQDNEKISLSDIYSAKVILVSGKIHKSEFSALNKLIRYINADKLLRTHIIGIHKQRKKSFILLTNRGGFRIELGELKDFDSKFNKLKLFYDQYLNDIGMSYYSKIDLKFNQQVVATKR